MATLISSIITQARTQRLETTAKFWTDAELLGFINAGIRDLWRRINDTFQDYFVTIDITNVTAPANTDTLAGIPTDVFRIVAIEPRIVGSTNPNQGLVFVPRPYNHPEFVSARAQAPREPNNVTVFYCVMNAGAPVGAPTILIGPTLSSAVNVKLVYNQVLAAVIASDVNPIPGESDNALFAWTVAYMRSKEKEDQSPDPEWLAVYATEKKNLVEQLTPRQTQEPSVVEAFFQEFW